MKMPRLRGKKNNPELQISPVHADPSGITKGVTQSILWDVNGLHQVTGKVHYKQVLEKRRSLLVYTSFSSSPLVVVVVVANL